MYFPQALEAEEYQQFPMRNLDKEQSVTGLEMRPILDASVEARAQFDFPVTPKANLGIKVLNPVNKEDTVIDTQIIGFINNTLRFEVQGQAGGGIGNLPAALHKVGFKHWWKGNGTPREKVLWDYEGSTSSSKGELPEVEDGDDKYAPLFGNVSSILYDEWFGDTGTLASRSLDKSSTLRDVAAFGNASDWFNCNDDGQCANGGYASDTCEWSPAPQSLLSSRQNGGGTTSPPASGVKQAVPCVNAVPAMMYNCKLFPDHVLPSGRKVTGICQNILNGFKFNKAGDNGPFSGIYQMRGRDPDDTNRKYSCEDWSKHNFQVQQAHGTFKDFTRKTWQERCSKNQR
ncbi:hypothetical protein BJX62DRAFT_245091 [Aspergillus germanicus]